MSIARPAATVMGLFLCACVASLACGPTSATERMKQREEMRKRMDTHRFWDEYEQLHRQIDRRFADRFRGQIEPGVGCDVCPRLCTVADLRPLSAAAFKARFRQAAAALVGDADYRDRALAARERQWLGCMAAANPKTLHPAIMQLLDPSEAQATRYAAAQQVLALEMDAGSDEHRRSLTEIAPPE